jgi:putative sterol carrier protein
VTTFASAAWAVDPIDPLVEAFAAAGGQAVIARSITGGPDGEVRYVASVAAGSVSYASEGFEDADVSFTDTRANALAIVSGELSPNAAFMRGQTKVTGPTSTLLDVLAAASGPAFAEACDRARAATSD